MSQILSSSRLVGKDQKLGSDSLSIGHKETVKLPHSQKSFELVLQKCQVVPDTKFKMPHSPCVVAEHMGWKLYSECRLLIFRLSELVPEDNYVWIKKFVSSSSLFHFELIVY